MLRKVVKVPFVLIVLAVMAFIGLRAYGGFVDRRDAEERAASPSFSSESRSAPPSPSIREKSPSPLRRFCRELWSS